MPDPKSTVVTAMTEIERNQSQCKSLIHKGLSRYSASLRLSVAPMMDWIDK